LQSMERFINIEFVDDPLSMLIVGCVGLSLNLISASIVHEHGHGHSHSPPARPAIDGVTEANDAINMEVAGVTRSSFSVAVEEHSLGDIHALHNHTRLPPPLDPHGNLGVLAVFIHVLGDAVNNVLR